MGCLALVVAILCAFSGHFLAGLFFLLLAIVFALMEG